MSSKTMAIIFTLTNKSHNFYFKMEKVNVAKRQRMQMGTIKVLIEQLLLKFKLTQITVKVVHLFVL